MEYSSSNLTPRLPNDITLQILIRLPLKTLVRFSCVSKSWHSLILSNQTDFARCHLQYHAPPRHKIWMNNIDSPWFGCNEVPDQETKYFVNADLSTILRGRRHHSRYPFFGLRDTMSVMGCCDGVFCILYSCYCSLDLKIYLWNPVLRQSIFLPRNKAVGYSTITVGFGFDSFSQDYIVAKVQYAQVVPEKRKIYRIAIYRLKTHSWTTIHTEIFDGGIIGRRISSRDSKYSLRRALNFADHKPTYSNCMIHHGYLYWLGQDKMTTKYIHATKGDDKGHFVIPDYVTIEKRHRVLGLYKGCLSVSGYTRVEHPTQSIFDKFELWMMPEPNNYNLWVKQFEIPNGLGIRIDSYMYTHMTAGGKILTYDSAPFREQRGYYGEKIEVGNLVLFDPESRKVEDVHDRMSIRNKYSVADNYVESLVSVIPPQEKRFPKYKIKKSIWRKFFCSFCSS